MMENPRHTIFYSFSYVCILLIQCTLLSSLSTEHLIMKVQHTIVPMEFSKKELLVNTNIILFKKHKDINTNPMNNNQLGLENIL